MNQSYNEKSQLQYETWCFYTYGRRFCKGENWLLQLYYKNAPIKNESTNNSNYQPAHHGLAGLSFIQTQRRCHAGSSP